LFLLDSAAADLVIGDFAAALDGWVYRVSIAGFASGRYDGQYRGEGERLPFDARRCGDRVVGQIGIAASRCGFIGQIQYGNLRLHYEDGGVNPLKRISRATRHSPDWSIIHVLPGCRKSASVFSYCGNHLFTRKLCKV